MYQVTKKIHFCYGHRLMLHPGKCAHYHGHNAVAEIICQAETLDQQNMVIDFDEIVRLLKSWIEENLDHRMILNRDDELILFLKEKNEPYYVLDRDPTAEALSKLIYEICLSKKLPVYRVILWESPSSHASYDSG